MAFIQRDDMVEDLPASTSNPAFGDSILPRSLDARPFRLQTRGPQERDHFGIELRIVTQNGVTIRLLSGECLPKLLDHPISRWVGSDIAVQNLPTLMINHEEAIQQLEGDRRYGEEIERHDHFAVVIQERQPTSFRITSPSDWAQISSNSSLRDVES